MDRALRLQSLWAWLPTFRAVAEQQSISRAAEQLGVSPSAVSRMVGLLEDDVGQPLFNRVGRRIELNAAGEHLLAGARSAMRMVDESLAVMADKQMVGAVRIASAEPVTRAFVIPTLGQLRSEHPALTPTLVVTRESEVVAALLRGELDVAFVRHARPHDQLAIERLGALGASVYAGAGHPLEKKRRLRVADLLEHAFVVSTAEEGAHGWWPVAFRRRVAVRVEALDIVAELCAEGELLAALPDVVAERHNEAWSAGLRKLPVRVAEPVEIFAMWRKPLDLPGRADAVVDAVRDRFARS
jgi:DNA-binding transcriptional LysR family regulator